MTLLGLNFLYNLNIKNNIIVTKTTATIGKNIEVTDMTTAVPVVAVEANRVVLDVPAIAAAVPPPAIIAKDHVTAGLKSAMVDIITAVPARAANGTAMVSNKLSVYGIK